MTDIMPDRCWPGIGRIFSDEYGAKRGSHGIYCYTNFFTQLLMQHFSVPVDLGQNRIILVDRLSAQKFFGQNNFEKNRNIDQQIREKIIQKLAIQQEIHQALSFPIDSLRNLLVKNPQTLLLSQGIEARMMDIPALGECHCCLQLSRPNNPSQDVRKKIEDTLVASIQQQFPYPKQQPLKICSIASGRCFQELVLHARLAKLGICVEWVLVDPWYMENPSEARLTTQLFTILAQKMAPGSTVQVGYDIEDFLATKEYQPDVVLAIDADLERELVPLESKNVTENHILFHAKQKLFTSGKESLYLPLIQKLYLGFQMNYPEKRIFATTKKEMDPYTKEISVLGIIRGFDRKTSSGWQSPSFDIVL